MLKGAFPFDLTRKSFYFFFNNSVLKLNQISTPSDLMVQGSKVLLARNFSAPTSAAAAGLAPELPWVLQVARGQAD